MYTCQKCSKKIKTRSTATADDIRCYSIEYIFCFLWLTLGAVFRLFRVLTKKKRLCIVCVKSTSVTYNTRQAQVLTECALAACQNNHRLQHTETKIVAVMIQTRINFYIMLLSVCPHAPTQTRLSCSARDQSPCAPNAVSLATSTTSRAA